MSIVVIIPVLNEADAIDHVIGDIPDELVEEVIVVNNGSTDDTARIAREAGATVLDEPRRGYGWACLKGIDYARSLDPDVAVFLDGDYSDHPEEIRELVAPIERGEADFVVGSRILGESEPGAMLPQAEIGNRLACTLMRWLWNGDFTDLGPFRAIRFDDLLALQMTDKTYGWTIEMQIKALQRGLRCTEVPVSYRQRIGTSKVTGTVKGTIMASAKILWTIAKYALTPGAGSTEEEETDSTRSSVSASGIALLVAGALLAAVLAGCRPGEEEADPTGPPYGPEAALSTFEVPDGVEVELFAHEPHVRDPVAMTIDEEGRVYVAEMPGYPLDTGGSGAIKLLRDEDGDGRVDAHTVFADSLVLPTGLMRWKEGILVTDSPDLLYLADTTGDGRADVREVVLTGFARSNPQHNTNSPLYGLDNRIYLANEGTIHTEQFPDRFGHEGDSVRFVDRSGSSVLPPNASGRNVRFRPDTGELGTTSASTQFGHAFDRWGRHFLVDNTHHLYHEVLDARYLLRNPTLTVPTVVHHTPDHGSASPVYAITENPQHQLLTDRGVITAACGLTAYLAEALPRPYRDAMFVAEPVHNLVHVDSLSAAGASFTSHRVLDNREFLASRDAWFRPVNFYVGPRGALYVVDYYRRVIEHPEWMAEEDTTGDLYAGTDRGRIYRITGPDATPPDLASIDLGAASDDELIARLGEPNVWWRRNAQRLLVDRYGPAPSDEGAPTGSPGQVEPERADGTPAEAVRRQLARTADGHADPTARLHALWTLEGIGGLTEETVLAALRDPHPGVRENALRLAERFLPESAALADRVIAMAQSTIQPAPRASASASRGGISGSLASTAADEGRLRFQLLLTLGGLTSSEATRLRREMLFIHSDEVWMQRAALSAREADPPALLREAIVRFGDAPEEAAQLLRELARQTGSTGPEQAVRSILTRALEEDPTPWAESVAGGLAEGLDQRGRRELRAGRNETGASAPDPIVWGPNERSLLARTVFRRDRPEVREVGLELLARAGLPGEPERSLLLNRAVTLATTPEEDAPLRADALSLLAEFEPAGQRTLFERIIAREEPTPVRIAAVRALGRIAGREPAAYLLDRWSELPTGLHPAVIDVLTAQPARTHMLLEAIGAGRITRTDLGWRRSVGLMMHEVDSLRTRARTLLGETAAEREERLERFRPALEMDGDPEAGRALFLRTCSRCHAARDVPGRSFGPDLATVRSRSPEALLRDVLLPGQTIADGYQLWTIQRRSDPPVLGIITAETSTSLTVETPAGDSVTIPRSQITERSTAGMSAMPIDLHRQISVEQMADLLAFLRQG